MATDGIFHLTMVLSEADNPPLHPGGRRQRPLLQFPASPYGLTSATAAAAPLTWAIGVRLTPAPLTPLLLEYPGCPPPPSCPCDHWGHLSRGGGQEAATGSAWMGVVSSWS